MPVEQGRVPEQHRSGAAGVFGVPTFQIGGELFWGQDRLDFVAAALARPAA